MENEPAGDEPPRMAGLRPRAHAGQGAFPSAASSPNSPPSEAMEATAKQAKTKTALDLVPILGQKLVSGHPGGGSSGRAGLEGLGCGELLLWWLLQL